MEYKSPEKRCLPVLRHNNLPVLSQNSYPELKVNEVCLKLVAVIPHKVSASVDEGVDLVVGTNLDIYV